MKRDDFIFAHKDQENHDSYMREYVCLGKEGGCGCIISQELVLLIALVDMDKWRWILKISLYTKEFSQIIQLYLF